MLSSKFETLITKLKTVTGLNVYIEPRDTHNMSFPACVVVYPNFEDYIYNSNSTTNLLNLKVKLYVVVTTKINNETTQTASIKSLLDLCESINTKTYIKIINSDMKAVVANQQECYLMEIEAILN